MSLKKYILINRHKTRWPMTAGNSGLILIGLIIAMIIFVTLGAAILVMFSTSSMNEVWANLSHKAFYTAESGYRYAASQYLNGAGVTGEARDDILTNINTHSTYTFGPSNQSFSLSIESFFYKVATANTASSLGKIPTEIVSKAAATPTGKLAVFNGENFTGTTTYGTYTVTQPNGIAFSGSNLSGGTRVFPYIGLVSTVNGAMPASLQLSATDDISLFPKTGGSFRIMTSSAPAGIKYEDYYKYSDFNSTTRTISGITKLTGSTASITLAPATDSVLLQRFIRLKSTGTAGNPSSNLSANRILTYMVPIEAYKFSGSPLSTGKQNIFDLIPTNTSLYGLPGFQVIPGIDQTAVAKDVGPTDGQPAIRFNFQFGAEKIFVFINWWDLPGLNLNNAYISQGHTLSYDMQLKEKIIIHTQTDNFLVGLTFRATTDNPNTNSFYGVSFFRSQNLSAYPSSWLGSPDSPKVAHALKNLPKNTTYLVFWKSVAGVITLLGHRQVTISSDSGLYADWPTIVMRITETGTGSSKTNNIKFLVYNKTDSGHALRELTWPTETDWASPVRLFTDLSETSMSPLTGIVDNSLTTTDPSTSVDLASIATPNPVGSASCTACSGCGGTCGRPEIGVHVFGMINANNKFFLDDFAIKVSGAGPGGGDVGFLTPIP